MILAQYTIRSKQEYIFRSNRLLDIVGGTEMIRDAFDWVFAAAEQEGVTCQPADVPFKLQAVQDAFAAGTLGMAELFRGGGNLTVLYRDRDTYLRVNRRFSRLVLENAPGMVPMAACCEANGQNYSADYSALMAAVDAEKNRMLPGRADYAAPFALRDRTTNQPIVCRVPFAGGQRELTAESRKKWEKGQRSDKRNDGNRLLDEMTTEWQEESLLAVIHADGNNMGVKIQQKLNGSIDYDFCVSTMRAFTAEIADAFTRTGETSLRDTMAYLQKEYHGLRETAYHYRIVVADGDDFTFICNARFALEYTCNYLKAVHQKKDYSADQAAQQAALHDCYAAIEQQDTDRILADTPDAVIEEYAQKGINRDDLLKLVQDYLPTYLKTLEDSCGGSITITADLQTEEQEDITDNYTDASLPVERAYRYPIVIRIQGDAGNREETRTSTAIQVDGNWYSTDITAFLSAANTTASSAK